jgi:hypothetical protein
MILVALLIGVVLIVAALRNSQAALFTALGQDVPGYVVWAAALFAVGAIGYVPGMKPISRGLLALVLIVIILNNYQNILNGFQAVSNSGNEASTPPSGTTASTASSGSTAPSTSSTPSNSNLSILTSLLNTPDTSSSFGSEMVA